MPNVTTQLEKVRKELLYLGLRNPLLNYRPLKARGVEVDDELPTELYRLLVVEQKGMVFQEREAQIGEGGGSTAAWLGREVGHINDEKGDDGAQPILPARYTDLCLQTRYDSAELQKRLHKTFYTAQAYIEEQGINILYLALGMLRWRERETAEVTRLAPLVLVPIEIYRAHANDRYHIRYNGTDIGTNLSLEAKLRLEFGLSLPAVPEEEGFDLRGYFANVAEAVAGQPEWEVDETAVTLGFFSFNKFLMYNDLDPAQWPEGEKPDEHVVLQALLTERGFREPAAVVDEDELIDPHVNLKESHLVVEADSSQLRAILDVNHGRNLVIQGPPGTGKSQTITNLIAEAVGKGKTVLFVSEKMAALNVVKRKLDQVGLGGAALALHSHTTTKRTFAEEMGRTLSLGRPYEDGSFPEIDTLIQTRAHLNSYSSAMNEVIGASHVTPFFGYGRLIELDERLRPTGDWTQLLSQHFTPAIYSTAAQWDAADYERRRDAMQQGQALVSRIGSPSQHPFSLSRATEPVAADEIRTLVGAWQRALQTKVQALTAVAGAMGLPAPESLAQGEKVADIGRRAISAPNLYAIEAHSPDWYGQHEALHTAFDLGTRLASLRHQYDHLLIPEAWEQNLFALRAPLIRAGDKWWRPLSGAYRQARAQLAGLCQGDLPDSGKEQLDLVDGILEYRRLLPDFERYEPLLRQLFGLRYSGVLSPWPELDEVRRWLMSLHEDIHYGRLAPDMLAYMADRLTHDERLRLEPIVQQLVGADVGLTETADAVIQKLRLPSLDPAETTYAALLSQLSRYVDGATRFGEMVEYNRFVAQLDGVGLAGWEPIMRDWPHAAAHLRDLFAHVCYTGLIERALLEKQALGGFAGEAQTSAVARFSELDRAFLRHNRSKLAHDHWEMLPNYLAGGQIGLLLKESGKKTNHQPIRQTMTQAAYAIQKLKPIFMMSPLSIAMFLPPGEILFDLVIFDEASQVRPVDAFGALTRGRQAVVVGDSRQLPPTTFFDRVLSDGDSDEDEDDLIGDNESILDLFIAQGAPQQMLNWHYRSQHESLIAISNQAFYDNRLVLFPSPDGGRKEVGIHMHHDGDTVYERGKSRTNPQEATQVAAAVMAHAQMRPHLTLGVATFSSAQREAIAQEVERLRRAQPELEPFFQAHRHEPFFVKNLENVQGDERDVILISIGYGRGADGKVRLNFGPLNSEGGERRLNVLITRARRRCEIFTNLTAEDIDLRRTKSKGVATLKAYLAYAVTGELPQIAPRQVRAISPFEQVVAQALVEVGYDVSHRVGLGGVEVDLAIKHPDPEQAGRYLLGIEFDGEDYHLAKSARDRDRIQAEVLTRLGWQIIRVWSTNWLRDPVAQKEGLLAEVDQIAEMGRGSVDLLAARPQGDGQKIEMGRYDGTPLESRTAPPYKRGKLEVPEGQVGQIYDHRKVGAWLVDIAQKEGPIHIDVAMRHISFEAGHTRSVMSAGTVRSAAKLMDREKRLVLKDDFLYAVGVLESGNIRLRDWGELSGSSRKFEYVSKDEIGLALRLLVQDALSMPVAELPLLVSRLLGFGNIGRRNRERVVQVLLDLVWQGRFRYLPQTEEVRLLDPGAALPEIDLAIFEQLKNGLLTPVKRRKKGRGPVDDSWLTADDAELPAYVAAVVPVTHEKYQAAFFARKQFGWHHHAKYPSDRYVYYSQAGHICVPASQDVFASLPSFRYDPKTDRYSAIQVERSKSKRVVQQWLGLGETADEPFVLAARLHYDLRTGRFAAQAEHICYYDSALTPISVIRHPETGAFFRWYKGRYAPAGSIEVLDLETGKWALATGQYLHAQDPVLKWGRETAVSAELADIAHTMELDWLSAILENESPIHEKMLAQRFAVVADYKRPTDLLTDFVEQLLCHAVERGLVTRRGPYVWAVNETFQLLHDWRGVPDVWRKLEYLSTAAVASAILLLVREEALVTSANLAEAISVLLGMRPPTREDKQRVAHCLEWLVAHSYLVATEEGRFILSEPEPDWQIEDRVSVTWEAKLAEQDVARPRGRDRDRFALQLSQGWPLYRCSFFQTTLSFERWDAVLKRPEGREWVLQVVQAEGPIHVEELRRRLHDITGVHTTKLELFTQIVELLQQQGAVIVQDDFVMMADQETVEPRYRHYFSGPSRKMTWISAVEIAQAIRLILAADRYATEETELVHFVSIAFFGVRLQGKNVQRIRTVMTQMVANGELMKEGKVLMLTNRLVLE